MRYKIVFEFKGENFFGSQKQPDKRTVQGELENALRTLTKDNSISIIVSGRTDAKVSAKYQVAHFDTDNLQLTPEDYNSLLYHINCILPEDIKIFELTLTDSEFHAQKDAKYKHYRYTILNSPVASVFSNSYLFYPYFILDIDKINQILSYIEGYHDFSAFKSNSDNPYDDCNIYYARANRKIIEHNEYIFIDIIGNRFLYNMIRIVVGDILNILRNNLSPELIKDWLENKSRTLGPNKVSPQGLTLEYVGYDNVENYIKTITKEGK